MSSSWVITASANPPRACFVDYPLGNTSGRPHELQEQIEIATAALRLIESATEPGQIVPLDLKWPGEPGEWKAKARLLSDKRTERFDTPQYERSDDRAAVVG